MALCPLREPVNKTKRNKAAIPKTIRAVNKQNNLQAYEDCHSSAKCGHQDVVCGVKTNFLFPRSRNFLHKKRTHFLNGKKSFHNDFLDTNHVTGFPPQPRSKQGSRESLESSHYRKLNFQI